MFESNRAEFERKFNSSMARALTSIGLHVTGEAKPLAPKDTGNLRASIGHVMNVAEKGVMIGTNVHYAIYHEKGTSKMKATPFLEPAAVNSSNQIENIIKKEFASI